VIIALGLAYRGVALLYWYAYNKAPTFRAHAGHWFVSHSML